jgi:hypothetical protein
MPRRPRVVRPGGEGVPDPQKRVGIIPPKIKDEAKAAEILSTLQDAKKATPVKPVLKEGEKSAAKIEEEASTSKTATSSTPKKRKGSVPQIKLPKKKKVKPVRRTSTWVGKKVGLRAGAIRKDESGKLTRVTKEEAKASITTVVPTVQPAPSRPQAKPRTAVATGAGVVNPSNRGFARNPAQVGELLRQAIGHLEKMKATHGTEEYHQHHDAFNAVHATLQGADSRVHTLLGIAAHTVRNPNHPNADTHFTLSMKALRSKLSQGRRVAGENAENARAGQARARAKRIAAEQAKKEGNA